MFTFTNIGFSGKDVPQDIAARDQQIKHCMVFYANELCWEEAELVETLMCLSMRGKCLGIVLKMQTLGEEVPLLLKLLIVHK